MGKKGFTANESYCFNQWLGQAELQLMFVVQVGAQERTVFMIHCSSTVYTAASFTLPLLQVSILGIKKTIELSCSNKPKIHTIKCHLACKMQIQTMKF